MERNARSKVLFCTKYRINDLFLVNLQTISYDLFMISVLIPTYNCDCSTLVSDLARQGLELMENTKEGFDFEIIVLDDCSTFAPLKTVAEKVNALPHCRWIRAGRNCGPAVSRNHLIDLARFPYLLFIDSYWQVRDRAKVVCGRLYTPSGPAPEGHELRSRYELSAERLRPAGVRQKQPYRFFTMFNVMFAREVFDAVRFDPRCTDYGYEDALLGLELRSAHFSILHIDNPLIHTGIDSNESFLKKTETALRTLSKLGEPMQSESGPSRLYLQAKRFGLSGFLRWTLGFWSRHMRHYLLESKCPSLFIFSLYKLWYYADLQKSKRMATKPNDGEN